jgi:hypothetical protein
LPGVSSQLPQDQRCRYRSLLDRKGQTQDLQIQTTYLFTSTINPKFQTYER